MKICFTFFIAAFAASTAMAEAQPGGTEPAVGRIVICRTLGVSEVMDGKTIRIPAGTYTGACDKNGENCRSELQLQAGDAELGPKKYDCAMVAATVIRDDGQPIRHGLTLLPKWTIDGFTPSVHAATDF